MQCNKKYGLFDSKGKHFVSAPYFGLSIDTAQAQHIDKFHIYCFSVKIYMYVVQFFYNLPLHFKDHTNSLYGFGML